MTMEPQDHKRRLPLTGDTAASRHADIDAELAQFEAAERERLGLIDARRQWVDTMLDGQFKAGKRAETTLLIGGLTLAHDFLIEGGLRGLGYQVKHFDSPDNEALRYGKEFGNRGQCNPTYYTVGNLVKYLCKLRDEQGWTTADIIDKHVFVTAGACGPCRFGMYVTEYRKALRDAGFEGFRVLLFQQKGGFSQATGADAPGLDMNTDFFVTLVKGVVIGDVLNALAYRLRPYEIEKGATDRALEAAKKHVYSAFVEHTSMLKALWRSRKEFEAVKVDRLRAKPKVSVIGEFWAMTTEGDGNYQLYKFLQDEGAEPDIQLVTAWLLYSIWEGRHDTHDRRDLRGADTSYYGLGAMEKETDVAKRLAILRVADAGARVLFQSFAHLLGLYGYTLPDMDVIAEVSERYYSNDLRGGEGHMEVGKLILNGLHKKAHMTISVKPFGCMPSASVSDGVQSMISEHFPGSIFCPVETSGDGRVNFYSRIQMYLFKARAAAEAELDEALATYGVTREQVRDYVERHPRLGGAFHKSPHMAAGAGADLVHEVGPLLTQSAATRGWRRVKRAAAGVAATGPRAVDLAKRLYADAPEIATRLGHDLEVVRDLALSQGKTLSPLFGELLAKAMLPRDEGAHEHAHAHAAAAE